MERGRDFLFVWLVGFSTFSSTTRLYGGRVSRQFYVLPREGEKRMPRKTGRDGVTEIGR